MITASVAAAAAALAGCADLSRATSLAPAAVNVESPVAATVADASRRSYRYPRFKSLPLRPAAKDVRKPESFKSEVAKLGGQRGAFESWRLANPQGALDSEAYAVASRGKFPTAIGADAPPADSADRTEAWAKAQRDAAQAPPPPGAPPAAPK